MGKQYLKKDILLNCKSALGDPKTFYNEKMVNYTGRTKDTKELYTEVIAEYIIKNINAFTNGIPEIKRSNYKMNNHNGKCNANSNRLEEKLAMSMFKMSKRGKAFSSIGKIIDYQIPLKNKQTNKAGKIDLLSWNSMTNKVYILELKKLESPETMLRCVLEGYTYMRTVNKQNLFKSFKIPSKAQLTASPFVFKESVQADEMQEDRPFLKKLMGLLDSKPFYIINDFAVDAELMLLSKNFDKNKIIKDINDWFELCPPARGLKHWKDGRSAKELAKDWTINKGDPLLNILRNTEKFPGIKFIEAAPEFESKFDNYRGKGRQHDLLVLGEDNDGELLIGIEAKADETFGEKIGKYYAEAQKKISNNINTNVAHRIDDLNKNLFGNTNIKDIVDLRYQLLHGIAGTVAEAKNRGIKRAIFVVSTYKSNDPKLFNPVKHAENSKDLDEFVKYLSENKINKIVENKIEGPFKFKASKYLSSDLELYILKIETSI